MDQNPPLDWNALLRGDRWVDVAAPLLPMAGDIIQALEAKNRMNQKPTPERVNALRSNNAVVVLVEMYSGLLTQAHGEADSLQMALQAQQTVLKDVESRLAKQVAETNQRDGVIAQQRSDKDKLQAENQRLSEQIRRDDFEAMKRTLAEKEEVIARLENRDDKKKVHALENALQTEKQQGYIIARELREMTTFRDNAVKNGEAYRSEIVDLKQQLEDARARASAAEARLAIRNRKAASRKKA